MKIPPWLPNYGDLTYRNPRCPLEQAEQISYFQALNRFFPKLAAVALHPRNEGKRTWGQARYQKMEGLNTGASDVIIPSAPVPFVCEIKRRDHTRTKWQPSQLEYLQAAKDQGCFVCVAFGWEAAIEATRAWQDSLTTNAA